MAIIFTAVIAFAGGAVISYIFAERAKASLQTELDAAHAALTKAGVKTPGVKL